jgi:hypothetical protein
MLIASIITPTLDQHWCALRAMRNRNSRRVSWTSDAHSAFTWVIGLGLLAAGSWYYLVHQVIAIPVISMIFKPDPALPFMLAAGILLPLVAWALVLELGGMKMAYGAAFVFWIIPMMIVVIAVLSGQSITSWPRWLMSFSGFTLPFLSLL